MLHDKSVSVAVPSHKVALRSQFFQVGRLDGRPYQASSQRGGFFVCNANRLGFRKDEPGIRRQRVAAVEAYLVATGKPVAPGTVHLHGNAFRVGVGQEATDSFG